MDNEKALISGEELKNGNYIITVNYANGKTVEKTYPNTIGKVWTEQYCPPNNVKYNVKIEFKHFPFWRMFKHHKRIEHLATINVRKN